MASSFRLEHDGQRVLRSGLVRVRKAQQPDTPIERVDLVAEMAGHAGRFPEAAGEP